MSNPVLVTAGLVGAVLALCVLRAAPRTTVVMWLLVVFFVPIWVGVQVGPFWSVTTLTTILAVAACSKSIELSPVDGIVAAFAVLIVVQYAAGVTPLSGMFIPLTEWFLPYVLGRIILARVTLDFLVCAVSSVAAGVAALAILEWITSTNYFVQIPPGNHGAFQTWSPLQVRGEFVRVEGAFGHSIALGATLSMCVAFVIAARWRLHVRLGVLILIAGAVVLTLSRIGLVTFVITLTLGIIFLPGISRASRILIGAIGALAATVVVPFLSTVFLDAGDEAEGSAQYRLGLLSLVQVLRPFGAARDTSGLTLGGDYLGFFAGSTDNAFMSIALRVGWVPTLLLVMALAIVALSTLRKRTSSVATVAVSGQILGLLAVAFITQYTTFFWFSVGLAVATTVLSQKSPADHTGIAGVSVRSSTAANSASANR